MAGTLRSWLVVTLALAVAGEASAAELRGSKASMQRQNSVAQAADLTFLRTSAEVDRLVVRGALEPVYGGRDYVLANVSHPYAQPEVRLFVERLAAQYRQATGEALVVTSLTRPAARQPGNAHTLSVHPAGMAVDLRVPAEPSHREWLEETLLGLEAEGLVDVTRERSPPHYHIAVFPAEYRAYVDRLDAAAALTRAVGGQAAAAAGGVSEGELAPARGSVSAGAAGLLGIAALAAALALGLLRGSFPRPLLATDSWRPLLARRRGRREAATL